MFFNLHNARVQCLGSDYLLNDPSQSSRIFRAMSCSNFCQHRSSFFQSIMVTRFGSCLEKTNSVDIQKSYHRFTRMSHVLDMLDRALVYHQAFSSRVGSPLVHHWLEEAETAGPSSPTNIQSSSTSKQVTSSSQSGMYRFVTQRWTSRRGCHLRVAVSRVPGSSLASRQCRDHGEQMLEKMTMKPSVILV